MEANYNEVAKRKGLSKTDTKHFIEFMNKRFPKPAYYTTKEYADEWADRFNSGRPQVYMDGESQQVYNNILERDELWRKQLKKHKR